MNQSITITREVVTREEAGFILCISRQDFETWLSDEAASDYARGKSNIPQMPHIPGKPYRFHLDTLREWWLRYFQRGGEARDEKNR